MKDFLIIEFQELGQKMSDKTQINRTLTKNNITNFILRVDLLKSESLTLPNLAEIMSDYFDRSEKRQISNFAVTFTQNKSELKRQETFDHVLVSEEQHVTMTFSELSNSFWIESNHYRDNSIYKNIMIKTVEAVTQIDPTIEAKRIGLRYINEFKCENQRKISKIYGKRLASVIFKMLTNPSLSRIIGVEEYNYGNQKLRLQYGIPNNFYPEIIKKYDYLLDIDSYIELICNVAEWNEVLVDLNHTAYKKFFEEMNPLYLEEIK